MLLMLLLEVNPLLQLQRSGAILGRFSGPPQNCRGPIIGSMANWLIELWIALLDYLSKRL